MTFKVKDHYFNKAKKENYLARSVYKLEEINQKYQILFKKDHVLDLGYHPGSWTQYASQLVGAEGSVVGIDIKEVNQKLSALDNVTVFQKDINDVNTLEELGVENKFDVVISDMAPNTTGIKSVDQARSMQLVEMVFYHLPNFLRPGGNFCIKIFDSHEAQTFIKDQKKTFNSVNLLKPKSTRSVSKEFFLIGKGFKGNE
ncbi:MAG: 50S rRNA methyltransferase [Halobacteriovoraceae bacterium]|nr:50S rRNA methyltransferase [Halobacteriovoraceae bacterium]|tara:strand:- start:22672 stop:23271 length:600 start_codon:yes stop_codon:yes gene_type:complete